MTRDDLGRIVHKAWSEWAKSQTAVAVNPAAPQLHSYDQLSEAAKEGHRQIGEAVMEAVVPKIRGIVVTDREVHTFDQYSDAERIWEMSPPGSRLYDHTCLVHHPKTT